MSQPRYGLTPLTRRAQAGQLTISSQDLRIELDLSPQAASNLLARWQRSGLVRRVGRGQYAINQFLDFEGGDDPGAGDIGLAVAALTGDRLHRIGFRSALLFHNLLHPRRNYDDPIADAPAPSIQIASQQRYRQRTLDGCELVVVHEAEETLQLGAIDGPHQTLVSGLERALIDAASRPGLVGGGATVAAAVLAAHERIDVAALVALGRQLGANTALRRIGSICFSFGLRPISSRLNDFSDEIPGSNVHLDPVSRGRPPEFRDRRWRVLWPQDPRAMKAFLRLRRG